MNTTTLWMREMNAATETKVGEIYMLANEAQKKAIREVMLQSSLVTDKHLAVWEAAGFTFDGWYEMYVNVSNEASLTKTPGFEWMDEMVQKSLTFAKEDLREYFDLDVVPFIAVVRDTIRGHIAVLSE